MHTLTHTLTVFLEKLASLFCRLGFEVESVVADVEDDEEDEGFILANSASKTGARDLTTVSRSDFSFRDWTARGTQMKRASQNCSIWLVAKSHTESLLKEEKSKLYYHKVVSSFQFIAS